MKELKPYWFLESPIDTEYRYYILMAYLMRVKESFKTQGFEKYFKNLITIKKDLESFDKKTELTQKTLSKMTDDERSHMYDMLDKNLDDIEEIENIVKNSIKGFEFEGNVSFKEENPEILNAAEVDFDIVEPKEDNEQ